MKKTLIIVLLSITIGVSSQETANPDKAIGFSCYFAGTPTKIVDELSSLLKEKKIKDLKSKLFDKRIEYQTLSALIINELLINNKIELTLKEKELLSKIKSLEDKISICSGCTILKTVQVKSLFDNSIIKNQLNFSFWFNNLHKTL